MKKEEVYEGVYYSVKEAINLYSSDQLDSAEFIAYLHGILKLAEKMAEVENKDSHPFD